MFFGIAIPCYSQKSITVFKGQDYTIQKAAPVSAAIIYDNKSIALKQERNSISLSANEKGKNEMVLNYAGFPVKKVDVNVLKDFKVMPGGQSIGVKLNTVGVLVVGHHQVIQLMGKIRQVKLQE